MKSKEDKEIIASLTVAYKWQYNVWNTAVTDIQYVLIESFEFVECFWKVLNSMRMKKYY